jgi:branched-chain amino acid aminotransferase
MSAPSAKCLRWYAVFEQHLQTLEVPAAAADLHDLPEAVPGLELSVYEAFRTFGRTRFLRLDAHFERADRSLALAGSSLRTDRAALRRALHAATAAWPETEARVRFDVLGAPATALRTSSSTLLALASLPSLPPTALTHGVRVDVARELQRREPRMKGAGWVIERRAAQRASPLAYEHILLDERGRILEGTSSNIFLVRKGELFTAEQGVLAGVTRGLILELARDLGLKVVLEPLPLAALSEVSEAFLTSASRGPVPIGELAGRQLASSEPGSIALRVREAYEACVERESRPALDVVPSA